MNLLIVEDDPMVGLINKKFAGQLDYVKDIFMADSPEKAKEILKSEKIQLILLDVYFPDGRGPELLQWVREEKIPCEVIFITADNSQNTVERALHLGALDYLVKPFTFERFSDALNTANKRIAGLREGEEFSQEDLDKVFKNSAAVSGPENLDKGLSYKSYDTVSREVRKWKEPFTAEQMAERLGMARVTIRRYLDFMVREGNLEVDLEYGKIGRPQHFYKYRKG